MICPQLAAVAPGPRVWEATMLRRIPGLRALLQRRRIARLVRETPQRTAAERAAAVRRIIDQARAER